jgi:hydroxymethylbilane synthase
VHIHQLFKLRHMKSALTIGTRGSQLALWQAEWVKSELIRYHPGLSVSLEIIKTSGDKITDVPLAKVGGKGLFVKEIEEALLEGRVDLAVHSMKDMPGDMPERLWISSVPERETPYDVLISKNGLRLENLPKGAVIGTSSLRRASQLLHFRPDFQIRTLRGNLDTRLRKLESEGFDAIILAAAGMKRLGMAEKITQEIPPDIILPAVGQGALCIETRQADTPVNKMVAAMHHDDSAHAVSAERAFLRVLQGGCQVPIAAYATVTGKEISISGLVAETDGSVIFKESLTGPLKNGVTLGETLGQRLIDRGAAEIMERLIKQAGQQ